MLDTILKNGQIFDGIGKKPINSDIGIKDNIISSCSFNVYKEFPYLYYIFIDLSFDPEAISPVFNSIKQLTVSLCPLNVYKQLSFIFKF